MPDPAARPRRSALYMPGANARAIEKARTLACDVVILDLEDSVAPEAKTAARAFVQRQPSTIRLGVVAFGTSAVVTQQPTDDRGLVTAAIDRLHPDGGTALGAGLVSGLSAIAGKPITVDPDATTLDDVDTGYYGSAAMVLLSDGENTTRPDPLQAADLVSVAGVKVYPIGLGSPTGTVLDVDGFQVSTALDEGTLREIADRTDGKYTRPPTPPACFICARTAWPTSNAWPGCSPGNRWASSSPAAARGPMPMSAPSRPCASAACPSTSSAAPRWGPSSRRAWPWAGTTARWRPASARPSWSPAPWTTSPFR